MADDLNFPEGEAGDPNVATKDKGGRHVQYVQVDFGDTSTVDPIVKGQAVKANSLPVVNPTDDAPAAIFTGQVLMTTTLGQRIAARTTRRSVAIQNHSTIDCYFGPTSTSATSGFRLPGIDGAIITINTNAAIHGVSATLTATISYIEEYY